MAKVEPQCRNRQRFRPHFTPALAAASGSMALRAELERVV
jgi:hypothetical protein